MDQDICVQNIVTNMLISPMTDLVVKSNAKVDNKSVVNPIC